MPKLKTNKAARKRFKITKNGKLLVSQSFKRHLLADRRSKKKRSLRKWQEVDPSDKKRAMKMLPYGAR